MQTARTLEPGDRLTHYRVVGQLGAGGMGEVYLARDQDLERNVAIKVLPHAVVQNEERLRRFVLEAKSASSLNHPSIVTIYEIGRGHVESADGGSADATSDPVHFISMELVTGKTFSSLIHEDKADLRTLLGYLAQVAEGLAKAHAAGIVHRDLKPGNIMVSADGFAKVLDFGLAKLTEKREAPGDLSTAATVADVTGEGVVLGTAGYMSPEQVQGKPVDHRSDIFSFGSILFEAVTAKQPFAAESSIETMHRILNDRPAPVEELNPKVPAEVRRLIRRCLAKNPEQRFQSMKDLAIELREIVDEYDTLSPSGSSTTAASTAVHSIPTGRRLLATPTVWGAAIVIIAAVGVTLFVTRHGAQAPGGPSPNLRMTTLTSRGDASDAVVSPDGRFVAFVSGPPGRRGLWVRQVATGSDVRVLPPQAIPISGVRFSPDGNYLYYLGADVEHPGYRALFRIPTLGGGPIRIVYDIDTPISFAPDGRHVCFGRGIPEKRTIALIDMDLESARERTVASVPLPRQPQAFPVWSPRGDRIAMAESDSSAALGIRLVTYRVADGRREALRAGPWPRVAGLAWNPDGRGLLLSAIDLTGSPAMQISYVPFPSGPVRKVTHDVSQYADVSVSADGKSIVALRRAQSANLWIVPADADGEPHPLTTTSGNEDAVGGFATDDAGSILFTSVIGQYVHLSTIRPDGSGQHALSSGRVYVLGFAPVAGGIVTSQVGEDLTPHLWRLDRDTGNLTQLTRGSGEYFQAVSRDGRFVAYTQADAPRRLMVLPAEGGAPRALAEDFEEGPAFSPDGQRLLYRAFRTVEGRPIITATVCLTASGARDSIPVVPPRTAGLKWSPDGQAFTFEDRADTAWNVCRRPVHGGPVERLTRFTDRRVTGHRWSPDGRWLLIAVQSGTQNNLWIAGSDGRSPRPLTNFRTGTVFGADWTRDSRSVVLSYGNASQDVVLIQGFD